MRKNVARAYYSDFTHYGCYLNLISLNRAYQKLDVVHA